MSYHEQDVAAMQPHLTAFQINAEGGKPALVAWINDAPSHAERGRRKNGAFVYLYGQDAEAVIQDSMVFRHDSAPVALAEPRIGYIVVVHWHYDATEQIDEDGVTGGPSKVYLDKDEAERVARQFDRTQQSGLVWEVVLP